MPKLKFPPKVRKKKWYGDYREVDRQVLQWRKMGGIDRIKDNPGLKKRMRRQRQKRLKQSLAAANAPTIDFFGESAPTPLADDQKRLEELFPAFKRRFNK